MHSQHIGHYINGSPATGHSKRTQAVTNPATGAVTAQVALADSTDVQQAVAAAQAAEVALEASERGLPTAAAILAQLPALTEEALLLQNNIALLDSLHTDMRIDSLVVRGTCFAPEAVAWLVQYLHVLPGMVLISSPDVNFPYQISALGGVRVINRSALREDRDLSLARLKQVIHKTAADLSRHSLGDDSHSDDDAAPLHEPPTPTRLRLRRALK